MTKGRILVVDDEYGVRSGIRQILELDDYEVEEAETGAEALAFFERESVDVVLLDYRLTDIDGFAVLSALRERGVNVLVCMITAYANIDTAVAATRRGVDFFLPKPFLPDDLLNVVATLLERKNAKAEADRLRAEHEASLLALAEEKTQTHSLVSSLRDAVLVVNRDGDVVLANRAMTDILGVPEADVLKRPLQEVLAGGALEPLGEQLASPSRERIVREFTIGERSFVASIATFRAEGSDGVGRVLTLSDISEVRRMAMEKERFIRTMVHELKSPLGAIKGLLEVVADRSFGDELEPYLPMIARADARIDAQVGLISDLLSLARSEQTGDATAEKSAAVAPALEECVSLARERGAQRRIAVEVDIAPGLPPAAIDPVDLQLVLSNLIGNAVKYNRDGGDVRIRCREEGGWLYLEVEDTGIGIKEENLAKILGEFFREKRPETRELDGNGLGLAIVRRLVERVGGRLELRSVEGEGSTFCVVLLTA